VVFGEYKGTVEMWLGIEVKHANKKEVKMQYLMELENEHDKKPIPGMYILTTTRGVHTQEQVAYKFNNTEFLEIKPKSKSSRSKTSKEKVQTKSPLDAGELQKLRDELAPRQQKLDEELQQLREEEEDDSDENGSLAGSVVAPVAPVAPLTPAAPAAPVAHVAPVPPVAPVAPVDPVAPLTPTAPASPVAPVAPLTAVASVAPLTPSTPAAPASPASPVAAVAAVAPVVPVAPSTTAADNKEAKETDVPRNNDVLVLSMAGSPANGQPGTTGRRGAN